MLFIRSQYYRFIPDIFTSSRRSFTQTRQLEDLQQLYQLLKHESLCKIFFSIELILFSSTTCSFITFIFEKNESKWNIF
jgi:hypothetical protein